PAPLFAESGIVSVNFAVATHPVKSIGTFIGADPAGAMSPKTTGNGVLMIGVQAAPAVCVNVKLVACVDSAMPGPGLEMVKLHTRPLWMPVLPVSVPPSDVGPGPKLAVTVTGVLTVMVCGFVVPV